MYYIIIGAIIFFVTILQASLLSVFFPMITPVNHFVVPNLAIIVLVFLCMYREDKNTVYVAFVVGLIQDIAFGTYIGLYAFTFAFIAYWANITFRIFIDKNIVVFVLSVLLGVLSYECIVWGVNTMFGLIDLSLAQSFDRYFWGSVLLSSTIAAILYQPVILLLENRGVTFYE